MEISYNPNTLKSYKISQKQSPKHTAGGVAQSPYPIYRHNKACLSKHHQGRAAGDPRLARDRSRVRAPAPAGVLFFPPPSLSSSFRSFFRTFPTNPAKMLGLLNSTHKPTAFVCWEESITYSAGQTSHSASSTCCQVRDVLARHTSSLEYALFVKGTFKDYRDHDFPNTEFSYFLTIDPRH